MINRPYLDGICGQLGGDRRPVGGWNNVMLDEHGD